MERESFGFCLFWQVANLLFLFSPALCFRMAAHRDVVADILFGACQVIDYLLDNKTKLFDIE